MHSSFIMLAKSGNKIFMCKAGEVNGGHCVTTLCIIAIRLIFWIDIPHFTYI